MATEQDIEDILASDVKIVDHTKRIDGHLVFPGTFMPDGREIAIQAPEKLDSGVLTTWCNLLRGEYSARKDRKEAEARRRAEANRQVDNPPAASPGFPGGGHGGNQEGGEIDETPLDKVIEAKAASLAAKVEHLRQTRDSAHSILAEAERRLGEAIAAREEALRLLDFLRTPRNAPEDSRTNRQELDSRQGQSGRRRRSGVVADKVPNDE